jgi:hypothetical protein
MKYDPVTRWLHAALAVGVLVELGLLSMNVHAIPTAFPG